MVIEYFMEWVRTASVKKREAAAKALVRAYLNKKIDQQERDDLDAALTILLEDNAPTVRLAIAESFGAYSCAPRHIMSALAADNSDIAIIVLSQSPVFHDSELINAVKSGNSQNQIAVSCRPWISDSVVATICEKACKDAILGILMNPAANFTDDNLHMIALRFGQQSDIRAILLDRDNLATATKHVLLGKLSEALGGLIREKSWMSEARVERTIGEAYDRASIIFAAETKDDDIGCVVQNLIAEERLTVSFLVRAICMGNIALVASAFSELSGIRFAKVESILSKDKGAAMRAVYQRAGLPQSAFIVFKTAITTWRRLLSTGSQINQARLPFIVTREVLEAYSENTDALDNDLLVLLRRLAAEAARDNSRAQAEEIAKRNKEVVAVEADEVSDAEIVEETVVKTNSGHVNMLEAETQPEAVVNIIEAEFADRFAGFDADDAANKDSVIDVPMQDIYWPDNGEPIDQLSSSVLHAPEIKAA